MRWPLFIRLCRPQRAAEAAPALQLARPPALPPSRQPAPALPSLLVAHPTPLPAQTHACARPDSILVPPRTPPSPVARPSRQLSQPEPAPDPNPTHRTQPPRLPDRDSQWVSARLLPLPLSLLVILAKLAPTLHTSLRGAVPCSALHLLLARALDSDPPIHTHLSSSTAYTLSADDSYRRSRSVCIPPSHPSSVTSSVRTP